MFHGYGVLGNRELWNNERAYHYIFKAGLGPCGMFISRDDCSMPLICDEPPGGVYSDPVTDEAPWYDENYPESAGFAGVYVTDMVGFDNFGFRDLAQSPFGTVASQRRLYEKTYTFTVMLTGADCCATEYGYRWLLSRLMERDCDTNTEAKTLGLYSCCTSEGTDQEKIDDFWRQIYLVKCVKDPEIVEVVKSCCEGSCFGQTVLVQFTLSPGNQKIYKNLDLVLEDEVWPEDVMSVGIDCVECEQESLVEIETVREKRRFPARVLANKTWCPVGDWVPSDYFDNPDQGYIEVVDVEGSPDPLNIFLQYDMTFSLFAFQRPEIDLRTADLCKLNFKVTHYAPGPTYSKNMASAGELVQVDDGNEAEVVVPIKLIPDQARGGTFVVADGGTFPYQFNQMPNVRVVVDNDCGCQDGNDRAEIIFNQDLTWNPRYEDAGSFPPIGYDGIRGYDMDPGTYIDTEWVTVEEAFNGSRIPVLENPYSAVSQSYCQPLEWKQQCTKIVFSSGVERAEPWFQFYSGSAPLYNWRADFFRLRSADDVCLCDDLSEEELEEWLCREPDFSVKAGRQLLADSYYIYEPRYRQIRGVRNGEVFDAFGISSSKEGGSALFVDFPDCYGVCIVFTAEVRKDNEDNIVSPAEDATVTAGYLPYNYVGI